MPDLDGWLTTDDDIEAECIDCGGDTRLGDDDPEGCECADDDPGLSLLDEIDMRGER